MGKTRRKKKQTQRTPSDDHDGGSKVPKTFIIERGKVGHVLSQLVLDLRQVMEPYTASKLKVLQKNVLKDFVTVAGPLGVTHLLTITKTMEFVNLKICCLPHGPTLTFHIKAFSLAREVLSSLKAPVVSPTQFLVPPMLALSNIRTEEKSSHLLTTVFQNMLPSISVHTVNLANIRRCLLVHSDPESKHLELRHYAIQVAPQGTSRGIKKLSRMHPPNLGHFSDISEYLLEGHGSESEGEEGKEGRVTLAQNLPGRGNIKAEQSTIRLSELGPRLTLELVKIEAGFCGGEVLHHSFVHKTRKEMRRLHVLKECERSLKEKRRKEQEANVARKRKEREEHRARCLAGMRVGQEPGEKDSEEDAEWFRKEVGEEPDPDTLGSGDIKSKVRGRRKRSSSGFSPRAKKHRQDTTHSRDRQKDKALPKYNGRRNKNKNSKH